MQHSLVVYLKVLLVGQKGVHQTSAHMWIKGDLWIFDELFHVSPISKCTFYHLFSRSNPIEQPWK